MRRRKSIVLALAICLAAGGVAYATVPDSGEVVHGCFKVTKTGVPTTSASLRIIDPDAGQSCDPKTEQSLALNQSGPTGPTGPPGLDVVVAKTSEQYVTNSTTLVDDSQLVMPVDVGAMYQFEAWLVCSASGASNTGCKFAFTGPSDAGFRWHSTYQLDGSATIVSTLQPYTASGQSQTIPIGGNAIATIEVHGWIYTHSAAGNLQLQFANDQETGGTTTMGIGSLIRLTRLS